MTLITCPECDATVSNRASSCPKCGYPLGKPIRARRRNGSRQHIRLASVGRWVFYGVLTSSIAFNVVCSIQKAKRGPQVDMAKQQPLSVFQPIQPQPQPNGTFEDALTSEYGYFLGDSELPKGSLGNYVLQKKSFYDDLAPTETVMDIEEAIYQFPNEGKNYILPVRQGVTITPSDIRINVGICYLSDSGTLKRIITVNKLVLSSDEAASRIDNERLYEDEEIFRIQEGRNVIRIVSGVLSNGEDVTNNRERKIVANALEAYTHRLKEQGSQEKVVTEKFFDENGNATTRVERIPPLENSYTKVPSGIEQQSQQMSQQMSQQSTRSGKNLKQKLGELIDRINLWSDSIVVGSYKYPDFSTPEYAYVSTVIGIAKKDSALYSKSWLIRFLIDEERSDKNADQRQLESLAAGALYGGSVIGQVNEHGERWLEALLIERFVGEEFTDRVINSRGNKVYSDVVPFLLNNLKTSYGKYYDCVKNKKTGGIMVLKMEDGGLTERYDILIQYLQEEGKLPRTQVFPSNDGSGGFYFLQGGGKDPFGIGGK